jgi:predicted dehydrogenase
VQLFGPVARVSAVSGKAKPVRAIGSGPRAGETFEVTVPTHVAALYEFESGQTAQSTFSFDSKLRRTQFEVAGVEGTLVVPDPNTFDGELTVWGVDDDPEVIAAVGATTTRGSGVLELARAIRAGRPERASGEQAFHILDIMVSTIEAAESGEPVEVASTVTLAPPLPEDWDPLAKTLTS